MQESVQEVDTLNDQEPIVESLEIRKDKKLKNSTCDVCSKEFASLNALRRHSKIHLEVKPYCCKYCDKRFPEYSYLKKHMRRHTGERPYMCNLCGFR